MFDPKAFPVGVIGNKFVFKANPQNVLAGIESYQGTSNHFEKLKKLGQIWKRKVTQYFFW
ncbi:hypothetical protein [Belliella pelovolcani]|uniref:hypothetical protein n=1 Tax=Belliella pelovolcani TaxID=529505 RepID=UPI00391BEEF1